MAFRAVTPKDYDLILSLDKKVYPTDKPVTKDMLDIWFSKNPEFGMISEEGICIAIPLKPEYWHKLINGEIEESDITGNMISDDTMGIHIYHIEKFRGENFYLRCLEHLGKISKRAIGFSGYCVTKQGICLFYNKLNCRERNYISEEYIVKDGENIKIEINPKISTNIITRCKMLITYPNEISIVWKFLK